MDADLPLDDPFEWFGRWYEQALKRDVTMPDAVTLATANADGEPSARVVLLKSWDEAGFVFYTNLRSRKGHELEENPSAALCFFWDELGQQVRVRGPAQRVDDAEADAYWASRARGSQIGGWASNQSSPIASREALLQRVGEVEAEYDGQPVPRPPHWTGVRIVPLELEFWMQGEFRLHDRFVFSRNSPQAPFKRERLCP